MAATKSYYQLERELKQAQIDKTELEVRLLKIRRDKLLSAKVIDLAEIESTLLRVEKKVDEITGKKRKSTYRPKIKGQINSKADAHAHIDRKFSKNKP